MLNAGGNLHANESDEEDGQQSVTNPTMGEILTSRTWKHALFTTYALSLSYFESEILRPLLQRGCDDIWLIADAEGYRASLLERRSARVGQEYRLIPAALPRGVFHAKCIYLAGDDGDLLLIGSGNVTFGGHGKNVEVFEALKPEVAPSAFEEFALFLESVGSHPDIQLARSEWVEDFAERARKAADHSRSITEASAVRLVHSLDIPVTRQLSELVKIYGPCTEAVIMSPYHDPDGSAVQQLLKKMGAVKGSVAVPSNDEKSPFPFAAAAAWDRPVSPVRARELDKRFVHAKWYEFDLRDGRLLLTGSINATRKALTTIDNVELGVLRHLDNNTSPLDWIAAAVPTFATQKQMPSGLGRHEIAYAAFDRTEPDRIHGHLITLQPPAGFWQVRLIQADGESIAHEVEVDDRGRFAFQDKALESFSQFPAVQILMSMDGREARGWVHNDMLLGMSARRRLTAGALSRLMRRDATDDDFQALLDYLSMQADKHLHLFNLPIASQDASHRDDGGEAKSVSVHIDELAPLEWVECQPFPQGRDGAVPDDQFHAAMARLRRMLLGHGRSRRRTLESECDATLADDALEMESGRTPEMDPIGEATGVAG